MKRFAVLTALVLVLYQSPATAQTTPLYSQNAIYFEAFGQGFLYSINYDHRFTENLALRVGFSSFTIEFFSDFTITAIPVMVEYLAGHGSSHLELGLGVVPVHNGFSHSFLDLGNDRQSGSWQAAATATIGYRYQPLGEGIMFRIGATPFFAPQGIFMWGGASLGYAF